MKLCRSYIRRLVNDIDGFETLGNLIERIVDEDRKLGSRGPSARIEENNNEEYDDEEVKARLTAITSATTATTAEANKSILKTGRGGSVAPSAQNLPEGTTEIAEMLLETLREHLYMKIADMVTDYAAAQKDPEYAKKNATLRREKEKVEDMMYYIAKAKPNCKSNL